MESNQLLNEYNRLRRWKAEASEVLARWDAVAERFDLSGHLGDFTADAVGEEIDALRSINEDGKRAYAQLLVRFDQQEAHLADVARQLADCLVRRRTA